jgi:hypothetical protein
MGLFPISFLVCLLLVYKEGTDFCMLILHSATLLKEFMITNSVLVEFLGSFRYRNMSSANRNSLTFPFISCSYLNALERNSKTILNRSWESGQPSLIPDFLAEMVSVVLHLV